ncbi:hypothetical protein MKEN_01132400 [Mycena kentingensis (nom. inval.)]|nr:hypothetical protein MKEN_01132400 [Mycena kentingensis (nom. inval.)]
MPATTPELLRRDAPRIGGSEAGFIGLVVGLSVIILVSCVGVFLLLKFKEPSERERRARKEQRSLERAQAKAAPALPSMSNSRREANASSASAAWTSLSRMFRSHNGHGWIQASGDAWEADEAEREMGIHRHLGQYEDAPFRPPVVDPYTHNATYDLNDPPPRSAESRPTSMLSYSLSERERDPEIRWTPRFTPSHSTFSDVNTIPRSASPESDHTVLQHAEPNPNRHMSVDSVASIRTFEGGTKFKEGL